MRFKAALKRVAVSGVITGLMCLCGAASATAATNSKQSTSCSGSTVFIGGPLGSEREAEPRALSGPLEASILDSFAVFRRAAQPSDQLPPFSSAGSDLDFELSSYYPAYVRQLFDLPDGARYFVIPAFERPTQIPPARCLPKSLRSQRPKLVEEQRKLASEPVYCIVAIDAAASDGPQCEPFADVDAARMVFASGFSEAPVVALVPDGVASVRVVYPTGAPIVASVSENAFLLTPRKPPIHLRELLERIAVGLRPGQQSKTKHSAKAKQLTTAQKRRIEKALAKRIARALAEAEPTTVEWLAADGALVRSISRATKEGAAKVISISG
jgi:hypothetical protein